MKYKVKLHKQFKQIYFRYYSLRNIYLIIKLSLTITYNGLKYYYI